MTKLTLADMWTIKDLTERFGLTERQVRLRLTALDGLLRQRMFTGDHRRVLLDDDGFKIFERLRELENRGLATSAAVEQLRRELVSSEASSDRDKAESDVNQRQDMELITILKSQIEELRQDKAYLQQQLARALEQLRELQQHALPPAGSRRRWWRLWARY